MDTDSMYPNDFGLEHLLDSADWDPEFVREILEVFVENVTQLMEEIQAALEWGDLIAVSQVGRLLEAMCANAGAVSFEEIAAEIAADGKEDSLERTVDALTRLENEIVRLQGRLEARVLTA